MSGDSPVFHNLNIRVADLEHLSGICFRDHESVVTGLALGIASSPLWSEMHGAELIVRKDPPAIVVRGDFDPVGEARLAALSRQLDHAICSMRYVSYAQAEDDCRRLAARLQDQFDNEELKKFHFTGIPRGGLIVLGMLSYVLGLEKRQLEPPGEPGAPLVVLDDCALTGWRFHHFFSQKCTGDVVFAPLYSHPDLRASIVAGEPRVLACVSARDLEEFTKHSADSHESFQARWQPRLAGKRYWIGKLEYVCFAWHEPDWFFWNHAIGKVEAGWHILPPDICLANVRQVIPIRVQPEGKGRIRPTGAVVFAVNGSGVCVSNLETGECYCLEGVAADIWETVIESGDIRTVIDTLRRKYDVDEATLQADVKALVNSLISKGILEEIDGNTANRKE